MVLASGAKAVLRSVGDMLMLLDTTTRLPNTINLHAIGGCLCASRERGYRRKKKENIANGKGGFFSLRKVRKKMEENDRLTIQSSSSRIFS